MPARIEGKVLNSYIGNGCVIKGTAINSIISPDVVIEDNAEVVDSVIFHNNIIRHNARLKKVICDKACEIGANVEIGFFGEDIPSKEYSEILNSGVTIIGKGVTIAPGVKIGANTVIYADRNIEEKMIEPGSTLR